MDDVVELPMFPLGSVLFPAMPLALRVFEPRYLQLLQDVLPAEAPEFGIVLIERGQEVGGGEKRFDVGTVAQVADIKVADGYLSLVGEGTPPHRGRRVARRGALPAGARPMRSRR